MAAPAGAQPLVQLHRAGLLEQVDDGVAVAAEAERMPASASSAGRADAVGEVALGGRAEAHAGPVRRASRCRRSVRWVACTAVVRGPSTPCVGEQRGRACGRARRGTASFSAGCSERCTCSGAAVCRGPVRDGGMLVGRHGAHRVHGRADPACGCRRWSAGDPLAPSGRRVAVAEAAAAARRAADRPRWRQVQVSSRVIRMPASAAASISAAPIAFGSA